MAEKKPRLTASDKKTFENVRMFDAISRRRIRVMITQRGSDHEICQALEANIILNFTIGLKFAKLSGQIVIYEEA